MNIAGFRKCLITFFITLLFYFTFNAVAVAQNLNMSPAKKNNHPKMSSHLWKLEKEYKEGTAAARMVAQGMNISSHDPDKVIVYLMSEPNTSIDEDALYDLGAQIIKQSDNVIKAKVPVVNLTLIADTVKGVSFMKTPDKLIPVAVVSEGVNLTGADTYHNVGYNGSGVKVAVIDRGFANLSSSKLSDDPDKIKKIDCTGANCVSSDFSSETDVHGTAVAEIVYDIAPGATFFLIKITDTLDLKDAKNYAIENGIKIINLSGGWFNQNFYDGECYASNPVCTANSAYVNNILWVNAAGNQAKQHYEVIEFIDDDNDKLHDEVISISVNSSDNIEVYLTWDAWPTTDQDYDLYLYDSSDTLIEKSESSQTGSQNPIEKIDYNVPVGTYYLKIYNYSTNSNHRLELYSISYSLSPSDASSSLMNPSDAAGVLAVGAIDYSIWTTGPQASYSSRGPTNDGRIKPDIMGPDNVKNDTFNNFYGIRFTGTSASCAHVSGAAALILDKNPGISVEQLWDSLTSTAIDMGSPGKDNIYGYGRLQLDINSALPSSTNAITDGGAGGGGCFIATAAYGSYEAPYVRILREMRDRFLLKNRIGTSLVNLYYKYSPPLADFITKHDNVKIFVRLSILPLVGISWLALKLGPLFTISLIVFFVFGLIRLFSNKIFSNRKTI